MTKNAVLLPSGLYDLLPPDARKESAAVSRLLGCFEAFGYEQVTPPLLEFETSLLSGRGEALALQTFRVSDPLSQAMMGFRADITMQVARIARSRLSASPRPLRLCYAGPILQSKPEPLRNERQLTQAGIELIGAESVAADAEVMIIAAESLAAIGITDISIDLNLPGLLGELCPEAQDNASLRAHIKDAIIRKDTRMIASLPVKNSAMLTSLIDAAGPLDKALKALEALNLTQAKILKDVALRVRKNCPTLSLTLDPIEYRGFDYHQGISFSIFAKGLRHELGRGGRYRAETDSATGFTLYITHLLKLLSEPDKKQRVLVPENTSPEIAAKLRAEGWTTVHALTEKHHEEAKRLGCSHIVEKGKLEKL